MSYDEFLKRKADPAYAEIRAQEYATLVSLSQSFAALRRSRYRESQGDCLERAADAGDRALNWIGDRFV